MDRDVDNRWKYLPDIEKTRPTKDAIPFLRSSSVEYRQLVKKARNRRASRNDGSFNSAGKINISGMKKRMKELRKETGWDAYVKPISAYNEIVHPSMKISFERI